MFAVGCTRQRDIQVVAFYVLAIVYVSIIGVSIITVALGTRLIAARAACSTRLAIAAASPTATTAARSTGTLFAGLACRGRGRIIIGLVSLQVTEIFGRFVDDGGIDVPDFRLTRRLRRVIARPASSAAPSAPASSFAFAFFRGIAGRFCRFSADEKLERLFDFVEDEAAPHLFHFEVDLLVRRLAMRQSFFARRFLAPGRQRFHLAFVRFSPAAFVTPSLVLGMSFARGSLLVPGRLGA